MSWLRRLLGFGVAPILSLLGPLVLLPLLTRTAGPEGWASIATGQALALAVGAFVQYGWPTVGPALVAGRAVDEAKGLYFTSFIMRATLWLIFTPLAVYLTVVLVPPMWATAAGVACAASSLTSLTASWFFVGRSDPTSLVLLDSVPRLAGVLVSALLLATGAGLTGYLIATAGAELSVVAGSTLRSARMTQTFRSHLREARSAARSQFGIASAGLLSLGYTRAAVPLVGAVNFGSAPVFAAADRMQSFSRLPLVPIVQSLQGWVYEGKVQGLPLFRERAVRAIGFTSGAGLLGGSLVAALTPLAAPFLFGPKIEITWEQSSLVGCALVGIAASYAASTFVLVPLGRVRIVSLTMGVASVVGVPAIWVAAASGPTLPLAAIAVIEVFVATAQVTIAIRLMRSREPEVSPR